MESLDKLSLDDALRRTCEGFMLRRSRSAGGGGGERRSGSGRYFSRTEEREQPMRSGDVEKYFEQFLKLLESREIRDYSPFTRTVYRATTCLLYYMWDKSKGGGRQADCRLRRTYAAITLFIDFPEFDGFASADASYDETLTKLLLCRLVALDADRLVFEAKRICALLAKVYEKVARCRLGARRQLGAFIGDFVSLASLRSPSSPTISSTAMAITKATLYNVSVVFAIGPLLREFVTPVVAGLMPPYESKSHGSLLAMLLRLHQPNTCLNPTTPTISMYHEPLVLCIRLFLQFTTERCRVDDDEGAEEKTEEEKSAERESAAGTDSTRQVLRTLCTIAWPPLRAGNTPKMVLLLHELESILEISSRRTFECVRADVCGRLARCIASENSRVAERALQCFRNDAVRELVFPGNAMCEKKKSLHIAGAFESVANLLEALLRKGEKHWNPTVNKMTASVLRMLVAPLELLLRWHDDKEKNTVMLGDVNLWRRRACDALSLSLRIEQGKETADRTTSFVEVALNALRYHIASLEPSPDTTKRTPPKIVDSAPSSAVAQSMMKSLDLASAGHTVAAGATPSTARTSMTFYDFVWGQILGTGSFSTVKYAQRIDKKTLPSQWTRVAVKIVKPELMKQVEVSEVIQREESLLRRSKPHPNCMAFLGSFTFRDARYLVLQYCENGDLHDRIRASIEGKMGTNAARFVAAEILSALQHLHGQKIVYGDLKPENVMLTASGHAVLGDFGSATPIEEESPSTSFSSQTRRRRLEGTVEYLAPEVLNGSRNIGVASDLWAFGLVIYQMLAGRLPQWSATKEEKKEKKKNGVPDGDRLDQDAISVLASEHDPKLLAEKVVTFAVVSAEKRVYPLEVAGASRELVDTLLRPSPERRLELCRLDTLRSADFFADIDFDKLPSETPPRELSAPLRRCRGRGGSCEGEDGDGWTRRRNSIMWSPMPSAYETSLPGTGRDAMLRIDEMITERVGLWEPKTAADIVFERRRERDELDVVRGGRRLAATSSSSSSSMFRSRPPLRSGAASGSTRLRYPRGGANAVFKGTNFAPKGSKGFVDFAG